jgi:hypothetical protein
MRKRARRRVNNVWHAGATYQSTKEFQVNLIGQTGKGNEIEITATLPFYELARLSRDLWEIVKQKMQAEKSENDRAIKALKNEAA